MSSPDDCPVHELAQSDPGATVQLYDETGRYMHPISAEMACAGQHIGVVIHQHLARAWSRLELDGRLESR